MGPAYDGLMELQFAEVTKMTQQTVALRWTAYDSDGKKAPTLVAQFRLFDVGWVERIDKALRAVK